MNAKRRHDETHTARRGRRAGRGLLMPMLAPALLLAAGCLIESPDRETVLYLEPDGTVTWSVLQQNVRSDADTPEKRSREERDFLDRVRVQEHEAAEALSWLRPRSLETRLLREQRPYTVVTTARLGALDRVYLGVLDGAGVPSRARLDTEGTRTRLTVTARPGAADDTDDSVPDPLWDLFLDCRIVLTEGRFVEAVGFEISDDGAVATPLELDEQAIEEEDFELRLELEWIASGG